VTRLRATNTAFIDITPQNDAPVVAGDAVSVGIVGTTTTNTPWRAYFVGLNLPVPVPTEDTLLTIPSGYLLLNDIAGNLTSVDENTFIASQFQVRSIPTVYAIFQGQPIADLSPARTEPQLKQMLDQLLEKLPISAVPVTDDPAAALLPLMEAAEDLLAHDDAEQAYGLFAEALTISPEHPGALSGLIRTLAAIGRLEDAQAVYDSLSDELRADPALEKAGSILSIAAAAVPPEELAGLKAAVDAAPEDHQARLDLANALMAAGDRDGAADALLHIIAADRDWNEGAAKARLLEIFAVIGLEDPWVSATRRKLSAILFG
jgi:putative thioredoxin